MLQERFDIRCYYYSILGVLRKMFEDDIRQHKSIITMHYTEF